MRWGAARQPRLSEGKFSFECESSAPHQAPPPPPPPWMGGWMGGWTSAARAIFSAPPVSAAARPTDRWWSGRGWESAHHLRTSGGRGAGASGWEDGVARCVCVGGGGVADPGAQIRASRRAFAPTRRAVRARGWGGMGPEVGPAFRRLSRDTLFSNHGVRLAETRSTELAEKEFANSALWSYKICDLRISGIEHCGARVPRNSSFAPRSEPPRARTRK
eukprot:gene9171-biopygen19699